MRLKPFLLLVLLQPAFPIATTAEPHAPITLPEHLVRTAAPDLADPKASRLLHGATTLTDIPRALTLITPELARDTGVEDYGDFAKLSAGLRRPHYLGIAGAPHVRGADAGVFFNGMRRAWQLLAFPPSTNATSWQALFKGPAPAQTGLSPAGGYLHQEPKRPTEATRHAALFLDSQRQGRVQLDTPLGSAPSTTLWRLAVDSRSGPTWYRHLRDERHSLYLARETLLEQGGTFLCGLELYTWQGHENLGWNRLTQDLIDHSIYNSDSGPRRIGGRQVLAAPEDAAEARNALAFADLVLPHASGHSTRIQFLNDTYHAEKHSPSNGFQLDARQRASEIRATSEHELSRTRLAWGSSLRQTDFNERYAFGDVSLRDIAHDTGTDTFGSAGTSNTKGRYRESALFSTLHHRWHPAFHTDLAARAETVRFSTATTNGSKNLLSGSFAPSLRLAPQTRAYALLQQGNVLIPGETGAVSSEENFARSHLREIGLKGSHPAQGLDWSAALFTWETATFQTRSASAAVFRSKGFELEARWQASSRLYALATFSTQRTWRLGGAPMRLMPAPTFFSAGGDTPAANPHLVVPGTPETQASLFIVVPASEAWTAGVGGLWRDGFYSSYDRFYRIPSSWVFDSFVAWERQGWQVRVDIKNLTNRRYFSGSDPNFLGNALITQEPLRQWQVSLRRAF